jgi:hypothetical protein
MTLPSLLLAFLISSLYGSLFHLFRDGGLGRLLLYLGLSWAGFAAGQLLGSWRGWFFLSVGPLNLGMATLGSAFFLGLGYWLSLVEIRRPASRDDGV